MPFRFWKLTFFTLFCVLQLVPEYLVAQTITAKKLSSAQGLSNDDVRDIHEDKFGYKWISTGHGLNKYDGYTFEVFRHNPQDPYSLQANSQGRLFEDHDGNIWVTLDIGGINKLDRASSKFHFYNYSSQHPDHLNNFVKLMAFDQKGRAWVGTGHGINLLDQEARSFIPSKVDGHEQVNVLQIFESLAGRIWIGTTEGLFLFNETNETFEPVEHQGQSIVNTVGLVEVADSLWAVTFNEGVYHINSTNHEVKKIDTPDDWIINNAFLNADKFLTISVRSEGIFKFTEGTWSSVEAQGLGKERFLMAHGSQANNEYLIITFDNEAFFMEDGAAPRSLIDSDFNLSAFWMSENDLSLWMGTRGEGLYQVTNQAMSFDVVTWNENKNLGSSKYAGLFGKTLDGNLLLTTEKGLVEYDVESKKAKSVFTYEEENLAYAITYLLDEPTSILVGTENGFFRFDKEKKQLTRDIGLHTPGRVVDFKYDAERNLWTIVNGSLINLGGITYTAIADVEGVPELFKTAQGRKLFIDSEGVIWMATVREGMFRIRADGDSYQVKQFKYSGVRSSGFLSQTINDIFEDDQSRLWIGGFSSGLMEFDRQREEWITHTPEGAMPIPNVQSIEQADDGALWISSINGLHRYRPEERQFKHYTVYNGLPSNTFKLQTSINSKSGLLFFGSTEGVTYFDPLEIKDQDSDLQVQVESVRLFDELVRKDKPIQEVERLRFRYNQNFIGFDFLAIDDLNPNEIVYSYRLEGVDESWSNGTKSRSVNYASLSPGTYIFRVRSGRDSGDWAPQEASITIEILSPFWQMWWFYILVFVLICSALYGIHHYRVKRKIQRLSFMESIRKKAAADFHDEMGNKLTRIALFSEVLERQMNGSSPESASYVQKIKDNSRNLNNSMRDFLWALDPKKDSAYDLASMLKDFGEELFDKTTIAFSADQIPKELQEITLTMDWKRHLIMTFKEAMHNVLKHAEASNVSLNFEYKNDLLEILLRDDGKGFSLEEKYDGYGLRNMKSRVKELSGELKIESEGNMGTTVQFSGKPSIKNSKV